MEQYRINKVWVDDANVYAETTNGWKASYPLCQWARLAKATDKQRKNFYLSRYGIHWPELDEDLSFEGLFYDSGFCKPSDAEDSIFYQA